MTAKKENSSIVKEALKFVRENEGVLLKENAGKYTSPRVSSEIPDCSMPLTFDSYSYCSLGCLYCFAYYFKSNNPAIKDLSLKAVDHKALINAIRGKTTSGRGALMYNCFYKDKFLLHWGGLADPFDAFEKANRIGYPLMKALGEENYPTLFSFKGATIFERDYMKLFEKYSDQKNFAFQVSMVTYDDEMSRNIEIGVPLPKKRIKAIKELSDMGYWTILRLRPYIIGVTDETIDELLEASLEAGISAISMEFFALDIRSTEGMKQRYEWISKYIGTKDILKYFKTLSPSERGGYMRLNRLVKEDHVKKVYKFCEKHKLVFGCSDPDFKELNTSGSCCAMPDKYPPNRRLENWTTHQWTYHLKEARKKYHLTGELPELKFYEVFPKDVTYLSSVNLVGDHIKVTGMQNAERYEHTYGTILQQIWNNLRSPSSPRNYFHGKVVPCGMDSDGNLIYRYVPMEYEQRWADEGIDLTR